MSNHIQGVSDFDPEPGEYTIRPAEWRRDAGAQLGNLTSGSGEGDEAVWHLNDVVGPDGTTVAEVCDDRRAMEGLQTSGRQFLFRSPDGEELMAYEREGYTVGTTCTLEDCSTGEEIASWSASGLVALLFKSGWELSDADGNRHATAKREWSLGGLFYPTFDLRSDDGTDLGRLSARQDGLFYEMDVELERSRVPTAVLLAMAYGVFWAASPS